MVKIMAYTAEESSRQLVYSALGEADKLHGAYVSLGDGREPSDFVLSPQGVGLQAKVWVSCTVCLSFGLGSSQPRQTETVDILSKVDSRIPDILKEHLSSP